MKHSSTWYALILIASALLLSAAKQGSAEPSPRPTPQPNKSAALSDHQSAQQITPVSTPDISQPPPDTGAPNTKENDGSDTATEVIVFFTVVAGLATAAIAVFNYQLVGVTEEMKQATAEAAEAAKQSARAAELLLNAERPYLFVENRTIGMYLRMMASIAAPIPNAPSVAEEPRKYLEVDKSGKADVQLTFDLRNYGKGPAVVRNIRLRMLLGRGLDENKYFRLVTIGREEGIIRGGRNLIGPGEVAQCSVSGLTLSLETLSEIKDWELSLRFATLVAYTDVYDRRFTQGFPLQYRAPMNATIPGLPSLPSLGPELLPAFRVRRRRYR
jgi:hypothetical protein